MSSFGFENRRPAWRTTDVPNTIELLEPIVYHSPQGWTARVPMGFVCDGASIPGFALSLLYLYSKLRTGIGLRWPDYVVFGGLHDAFYRSDFTLEWCCEPPDSALHPSRLWYDRAACEALATLGKPEAECAPLIRGTLAVAGSSSYQQRTMEWGRLGEPPADTLQHRSS